mgnify:FL=1
MENNQRCVTKKVGFIMPKGKGTYGSKIGRPKKRKKMTKPKRRK